MEHTHLHRKRGQVAFVVAKNEGTSRARGVQRKPRFLVIESRTAEGHNAALAPPSGRGSVPFSTLVDISRLCGVEHPEGARGVFTHEVMHLTAPAQSRRATVNAILNRLGSWAHRLCSTLTRAPAFHCTHLRGGRCAASTKAVSVLAQLSCHSAHVA